MYEAWALKAIKDGHITIDDIELDIVKTTTGSCDGCYYRGKQCPSKAITICCSGGNILVKKK